MHNVMDHTNFKIHASQEQTIHNYKNLKLKY